MNMEKLNVPIHVANELLIAIQNICMKFTHFALLRGLALCESFDIPLSTASGINSIGMPQNSKILVNAYVGSDTMSS